MVGIYCFTNKINKKRYIGQSKNIGRRFSDHLFDVLQLNNNNLIYRAIRKYKITNFTFEILEICKPEELDEKEIYYIKIFDSYYKGYNSTLGGEGTNAGRKNSLLTELDVMEIKQRIVKGEKYLDIYNNEFFNKLKLSSFKDMIYERTWSHVKVKNYDSRICTFNKTNRILVKEEVYDMRLRYMNGEKLENIFNDYKTKISKDTFNYILKNKLWKSVLVENFVPLEFIGYGKKLNDEEVFIIKSKYMQGITVDEIYKQYQDKVTKKTIIRILNEETWKSIFIKGFIPLSQQNSK